MSRPSEFRRVLINVPRQQQPLGLACQGKIPPANEKQCSSAQNAQLLGEERFAPKRECIGSMKAESRRATQYPYK